MKILQGYIDIGGQANRYSRAIKKQGFESEAWFYERTIKSEPYDRLLNFSKSGTLSGRFRKLKYLKDVLERFSVLHIHKGYSMFHIGRDLKLAKMVGKKIFIHYRGSEIRKNMKAKELEKKVIEKVKRESEIANMILIKDGQLGELIKPYVENFQIFPNIVDVSKVEKKKKSFNFNKKLKIIHIPSNPKVKGTAIIREQISKIKDKVIYQEFTSLTHNEVLTKYQESDIVIDQLLTGTYGNASLEAMALGTPVLNFLNPTFTKYEPSHPPIISVDPSNLNDVILMLDRNREILKEKGRLGEKFVAQFHSFEMVGKKLINLYETY